MNGWLPWLESAAVAVLVGILAWRRWGQDDRISPGGIRDAIAGQRYERRRRP